MTSSLAMALYGYPRAMRRRTSCSRAVSWSRSGSADGPGLAAKASSTKPARRGEKTASPSATRRMASASSGPEMVLVTYPRAPALITLITSSAASDTEMARNRMPGSEAETASITARPPPSGMCTSTRTTSGLRSVISSTAAATSSASPTTSTLSPSSARTPDRNRWWSSTMNTVGFSVMAASLSWRGPSHVQLDLGALARAATHDGHAAVPGHASDDRFGDPPAVGVDRRRVETHAAVPDEDGDPLALDLDEHL